MGPHAGRGAIGSLVLLLAAAAPAAAQDSRAAQHEQQQAARAQQPTPALPNIAERAVTQLRRFGVLGEQPAGFHPLVTSVYPGGALAIGAGYRRPWRDSGALTLSSAWSLKNFRMIETGVRFPTVVHGAVTFDVKARWMNAPGVAFYGIGDGSRRSDQVGFDYQPTSAGVTATARSGRNLSAGAGAEYLTINRVELRAGSQPSFDATRTPGLGAAPAYVVTRAFAAADWRSRPGYAGSGGSYRIDAREYRQTNGSAFGFRSGEAEAVQLLPLLRANWVIALRGLVTVTDAASARDVPFYLLPAIGGSDTLRGYAPFRFVDRHRLVLNAEWRWTPARFLDAAIFFDAGKVAARWQELSLRGLRSSYGIGTRIHGAHRTVLRLELARSGEGAMRFVVSSHAAF